MNLIIGRALEVNNEKLSQDISSLVNEKLSGEMELLLPVLRPERRGAIPPAGRGDPLLPEERTG